MALVCNGVIDQAHLETFTVMALLAVAVNLKIPNGTRKQAIIGAIIAQHVLNTSKDNNVTVEVSPDVVFRRHLNLRVPQHHT